MDGFDTSFFFAFKDGHENAVGRYRDVTKYGREAAVSTVTVFELLRHGYVGRLDRDFAEETARSVAWPSDAPAPMNTTCYAGRLGSRTAWASR
jgi:predicted nucleic acid-binding protein